MEVVFDKMNFLVLKDMLDAAMAMDEEIQEKKVSKQKVNKVAGDKTPADQKLRLLQPW